MNLCPYAGAIFAASLFAQISLANYALFTEPTDTISINGNTVLGTAATYEARIQLRGTTGLIFNEWRISQEDKTFQLTNDTFYAFGYGLNHSSGISAYPIITQYQWHHVAYVYDGSEERLYLDGQLLTSRDSTGNIKDTDYSISGIGGYVREGFRPGFIGLMDTFRISSIARYTGTSFEVPQGDFVTDADTELLFNFTEAPDSLTVTDLSHNASIGFLGAGFTGATTPLLISTLPIEGDLDYDGYVGLDDLAQVLEHWNENAGVGNTQAGDITSDGYVGLDDLQIILDHWNEGTPTTPPGTNIPEPASALLLGLSTALLVRRR